MGMDCPRGIIALFRILGYLSVITGNRGLKEKPYFRGCKPTGRDKDDNFRGISSQGGAGRAVGHARDTALHGRDERRGAQGDLPHKRHLP